MEKGPVLVDLDRHSAVHVGDEPLLLARQAPTWVSRSKRAGAQSAIMAGADIIIMDDGFQNPTIAKDYSILLVSDRHRQNHAKIFPAGPMRESLQKAQDRADSVIDLGSGPAPAANHRGETLNAWLDVDTPPAVGRVLAFCGIANPDRFVSMLKRLGFDVADAIAFPDHYQYTPHDVKVLKAHAKKLKARLMTTEKDLVRILADQREDIETLPVRMHISDPDALISSMLASIENRRRR